MSCVPLSPDARPHTAHSREREPGRERVAEWADHRLDSARHALVHTASSNQPPCAFGHRERHRGSAARSTRASQALLRNGQSPGSELPCSGGGRLAIDAVAQLRLVGHLLLLLLELLRVDQEVPSQRRDRAVRRDDLRRVGDECTARGDRCDPWSSCPASAHASGRPPHPVPPVPSQPRGGPCDAPAARSQACRRGGCPSGSRAA